jgi:exopolysaccharide/PEP-CTERM locus tyrosine autokinase
VSLIESALQKLRRGVEPNAEPLTVPTVVAAAPAPAAVKLPPAELPAREEPTRRVTTSMTALRAAGYLPEEGMERRFADHFRQIKRPLIEKALTGGVENRLILVTSALPGDGKTFTSLNLALSMARERDIYVLLVDADGPRAQISDVLGVRQEPGLLDALADESLDVESLIQGTDVRGLELLPAGRFIENATELLASARMSQIATRLAARSSRRLIVLDSGPLLVSSEARALTRLPCQVVLVVRAGATPRRALQDAVAQVDRHKLQGLVVNQARPAPGASYHYGYYAYEDGAESTGPGRRNKDA